MDQAQSNLERLAKTFVGKLSKSQAGWMNDDALFARAHALVESLRSDADMLRAYSSTLFGQRMAWTLGKAADALEWGLSCSDARAAGGRR